MAEGRILAAEHEGAYVLKFVGDVRVNLCTAIDDYFQRIYDDPEFVSVLVDLCEAEGIDSTTLGLLAKLALRVREQHGMKPALYSSNPGINRLLQSMAFGKLFVIHQQPFAGEQVISEIPIVAADPEAARARVLEAHQILMGMSDENRDRFRDLVSVLEAG